MEDIEIDIFYIEIETLSAYDLIEFLTINNKSHEVRCATFEALQKRARQFASKGPEDKVGIPYYLYRVYAKTNFIEVVTIGKIYNNTC